MKTILDLRTSPRGFAALISAILLSAILTALVFAESTSAFWSRSDQTDTESKAVSTSLADACVYEGLLQYEEAPLSVTYPESISVSAGTQDSCTIAAISMTGNLLSITAHAAVAKTYVQVTAIAERSSTGTFSLLSWK